MTVLCPNVSVGDTGDVDGVTYTKRDEREIDVLVADEDFGPLATTCTSGTTDMSSMFLGALSFNEDIGGWCVSNIPGQPQAFAVGASSWTLPYPVWGTCP